MNGGQPAWQAQSLNRCMRSPSFSSARMQPMWQRSFRKSHLTLRPTLPPPPSLPRSLPLRLHNPRSSPLSLAPLPLPPSSTPPMTSSIAAGLSGAASPMYTITSEYILYVYNMCSDPAIYRDYWCNAQAVGMGGWAFPCASHKAAEDMFVAFQACMRVIE